MRRVRTFAQSTVRSRTWPLLVDVAVFAMVVAIFYLFSVVAHYWFTAPVAEAYIERSPRALPIYAFYSLVRMATAYVLSMAFALTYGYIAAYNKRAEVMMIAVLDVLQSIPVLSFLPGVMLATVALFPTRQLGLELGSIILIFTGQVWNIAFSFYSSLKAIPRELREATRIYRFSRWQRFFQLELPFSTIGLVWNSMVSVAQGWFTLMLCEMFVLNNRDFRLPGLGSYLKTAADHNDKQAMAWGLVALIAVIVLLDQLLWRPLIIWSDKFKFEQVESAAPPRSPLLSLLFNSTILRTVRHKVFAPLSERLIVHFATYAPAAGSAALSPASAAGSTALPHTLAPDLASAAGSAALSDSVRPAVSLIRRVLPIVFVAALAAVTLYGTAKAGVLLSGITSTELSLTFHAAGATLLRVTLSLLLAVAWCVPAGVAIGFHPRLARYAQPLAQIAASVPATALFPIILLAIIQMGGGINVASIILMLLGTQWYILFNVIAGALAIPSDMRDVSSIFRFNFRERWMTVILPGIFPYLVTGLVTASGGAWNASIVAEYFRMNEHTYTTLGLGAQISLANDSGNGRLLLLSTVIMAAMVVTINRLLWKPLFRLSESRYRLDS
jgi:NitT/TauT family transport system permease protein